MRFKKVMAVLLAAVMSTSMLTACADKKQADTSTTATTSGSTSTETTSGFDISSASTLNIRMLGKIQTGNKTPKEDKLTPIWREKTKVIPETVTLTAGQTYEQYFQMQQVAETMPEILAEVNGIYDNPDVVKLLKKQGTLRTITLEEIKKYMPLTVKRLEEDMGISVDEWFNANVDATDKKLWYLPGAPNLAATNYKDLDFVKAGNSYYPYTWYFRDDILKQIFPTAKTEKELRDLYVSKQGNLSYEDINDVPILSMDDLYNYLKKVKDLDLKVGNKPVTPGQIQCNNDVSSLMWSCYSLPGYAWASLGDRLSTNEGNLSYFAATPEWKNYIKFFNKLYNEGLIGKETFIQKDEQRDAKAINGEYAVFQSWLPVDNARKTANGAYGYRKVGLFLDDKLSNAYQDFDESNIGSRTDWGAIGITTQVKEENIPQILNWIDWNFSEEANTLRTWGTSDFYTGEGKDRRFKPEYKDLENWALSGTSSEKDGIYYGMYFGDSDVDWNHETYGVGITWALAYTPRNIYPPEISDATKVNIDSAYDKAVKLHYYSNIKHYKLLPVDDTISAKKSEFLSLEAKFGDIKKTAGFDCDGAKNATAKAIIGKPEDFEKNYESYEKFLTPELMDSIKQQSAAWKAYQDLLNEKYREEIK